MKREAGSSTQHILFLLPPSSDPTTEETALWLSLAWGHKDWAMLPD